MTIASSWTPSILFWGVFMKKNRILFSLLAVSFLSGCASAELFHDPMHGVWAYYGNAEASQGFVYMDRSEKALTPQDKEKRYFATSGFIEDVAIIAKCLERNEDGVCQDASLAMMDVDGNLLNKFGEYNYPELIVTEKYPAAVMYVDLSNIRAMFPLWDGRADLGAEKTINKLFHDERLLVEQNGLFGYVDKSGRPVIAPHFLAAENFHDGQALVITDAGIGTIDVYGQFTPADYACIASYDDTLRRINVGGRLVNYALDLRTQQNIYISESLKTAHEQRPDAAQICIEGKWGLIDAQNKIIVPPEYDELVNEESTDYIWVKKTTENVVGFYDHQGNQIVKPEFPLVYLGEYFFIAQNADGKYAILDKNGSRSTEFVFDTYLSKGRPDNIGFYLQSESAVLAKEGLWGAVRPNGTVNIPFEYEELTAESEGLIGFKKGKRWGVLDDNNTIMHSPIYGLVGLFEDGRAKADLAGDEIFIYRDDNARNAWLEKSRLEESRAAEAERLAAEEARQQQLAIEQERLEEQRKQTKLMAASEIDRLQKEAQAIANRIEVLEPQYEATKSETMRLDLNRLRSEKATIEEQIANIQAQATAE